MALAKDLPSAPPAAPLLEREREVAALSRVISHCAAGDGGFAVVEAAPGLGKTRLLAAARDLARGQGLQVLHARAGELEGDFAFGVVRQLFEPLLATSPPDVRQELYAGAAALVEPLFSGHDLDGQEQAAATSFAVLHGLYWLAVNAAARRPTLIAVDDLHWADSPSLRWLLHLTRRIEAVPLAVVVATRPPERAARDRELVLELVADPAAEQVRPGRLGGPSVAELVRRRYGREAEPSFIEAVADATGGNPLFVQALVDTLAREGVDPVGADVGRILALGGEAVARSVRLRVSRLSTHATTLARAAAVVGDGTALRDAAAVASLPPGDAAVAASELQRGDLLRAVDPIEFSHPIVRSAMLEMLDAGERARTHRGAAEVLAASGAAMAHAAAHLLQTPPGDDPFVVTTLREAAQRALAEGAADAAVAYLQRALAEDLGAASRADLLVELGLAERLINGPAAVDHLRQGIGLMEDPVARSEVGLELGRALWFLGRTVDALGVIQGAIGDLEGCDEPDLAERLEAELISAAWWEPQTHHVVAERIGALDLEALHGGIGSDLLYAMAGGWQLRNALDRSLSAQLMRRALASGRLEAAGAAGFAYAAAGLMVAGELDEALAIYDRAVADARRRGDVFHLAAMPLLWRGRCQTFRGELTRALTDLREALDLAREHQVDVALPYTTGFLADALLDAGDAPAAQEVIEALGLPEALPPTQHLIFFRLARARVRIAGGDAERGLQELRDAGELCRLVPSDNPAWVPWRRLAVEGLRRLDRLEEARALAEEELAIARRWGAAHATGASLRAAASCADAQAALPLLEEAVELLRTSAARLELARALIDLGAALRRANRRSDARPALREGVLLAQRLGAAELAERGNEEIAATGARPRKLHAGGLDALTASERRIAQLAAGGKSNKEIAQELFVTVKTVELHLSNCYRKLDIASRNQLATALDPASAPEDADALSTVT